MDSYPDYPGRVEPEPGNPGRFPPEGTWVQVSFVGQAMTNDGEEIRIKILPHDRGEVGFAAVVLDRRAWKEATIVAALEPIHFRTGDLYRVNLNNGGRMFLTRIADGSWHSAANAAQTNYTDETVAAAVRDGVATKLEEVRR